VNPLRRRLYCGIRDCFPVLIGLDNTPDWGSLLDVVSAKFGQNEIQNLGNEILSPHLGFCWGKIFQRYDETETVFFLPLSWSVSTALCAFSLARAVSQTSSLTFSFREHTSK